METLGSYAAKTRFSELLERVAGGEEITITKHGVPVARLVPANGIMPEDRQAAILVGRSGDLGGQPHHAKEQPKRRYGTK